MSDQPDRPIIGVLGGMGPLAGAHFLRRLVELMPATRDQDHVAAILVNDPAVPDRVAPILSGGEDPLPAMIAGLRRLERAGATVVAIACNTAHHWHSAIVAATRLPTLDMVDAAIAELTALNLPGPVGILATRGTLATKLYQDRLRAAGREALVPDDGLMARILPAIAAVKAGRVVEAATACRGVAEALAAVGARSLLLACTEISVAWGTGGRLPVIDANDALARAALAAAGRKLPPQLR